MNIRQKYLLRISLCLALGFVNGLLAADLFIPDGIWPALLPSVLLSGWVLWKAGIFK